MGTGRLAFQCALVLKDYFADSNIEVVQQGIMIINNTNIILLDKPRLK